MIWYQFYYTETRILMKATFTEVRGQTDQEEKCLDMWEVHLLVAVAVLLGMEAGKENEVWWEKEEVEDK